MNLVNGMIAWWFFYKERKRERDFFYKEKKRERDDIENWEWTEIWELSMNKEWSLKWEWK